MEFLNNRRVSVLHILSSAGMAGGERYVFDLVRHSDHVIRHMVILPYKGPFEKILKDNAIRYRIVDMTRRFSILSLLNLVVVAKRYGAEIIHTHGFRANLYGRMTCLLTRAINISTIHVSLLDYLETPPPILAIYVTIEKLLSFVTSKFICISKAMADDMRRLGTSSKKIVVIQNGMDLDRFYPRPASEKKKKELGIERGAPVIGTVGRLVEEKGQIYLIEALKYIKKKWGNLRCIIIGEGPKEYALKTEALRCGVSSLCIFAGVHEDIENIYPLFDVFVLPSLREPFGLSLLEAMASGIPVIATEAGGPLDFVESGVNGILVPPRDARVLAEKIECLLSDKSKSEEIATRGRATVVGAFDIKNTVKKTVEIYFSVARRSSKTS